MKQMTDYTLMHKNIPIADIAVSPATGNINKVSNVISPEHLPAGVHFKKDKTQEITINRAELDSWWGDRCIPESRDGVNIIFDKLNVRNPKALITNALGLSLSDVYWVKPKGSNIKWEDVNFFGNTFSSDMSDILFETIKKDADFNLCSPDNTTDGCLKKKWQIIDGKRCLIKGGNDAFSQQPFNEVIASRIMDRLDIPHIPYEIYWQDGYPYSVCETFVTPETELISAWNVLQIRHKANHENNYTHYVKLCKEFGMKNIEHDLDQMLILDYIIANEDRHFNNFGIVRNADTLKWTGTAPIFDNGTSLGYDKLPHRLHTDIKCKPFKTSHEKQLAFVKSFAWINFSKLNGIEDEISEIMSTKQAKEILGDTRHNDIARFVRKRINRLESFALQKQAKIYE
ncbi:MAG: HipA domain-containing protein [Oscillospiraceae bacterium]|nr:HipA domain-containing protein [Oscillospiraceae bacterium]